MDERFLDTRIKHIRDDDLFSSLKLHLPGLAAVRSHAKEGDVPGACDAWRDYLSARLRSSIARPKPSGAKAHRQHILAEADLIVARDIKCWGGVRVQYDGEIDFSRNLGGSSNYGFHYFGWISPLGAAYRLTKDEKYARAFVEIFLQWYRQRDLVKGDIPAHDVIWYELGAGGRPHPFINHYFATIDSEAARPPEYQLAMLKTLLGHGRWLYRHETSYVPGNWQIYGSQGLLRIALAFPEFKESTAWSRRGLKWICEHTRRDVYADGCHKERAPHYHLGVAGSFFSVYQGILGAKGIARQREAIRKTASRMLTWTMSMMTPSGHSPTIGDSEYDVPQDTFLHHGLVLRNPELVWASRASAREIEKARKELALTKAVLPRQPANPSYHLKASGFVVVRGGWKKEDLYFTLNYGPYGGGHSHAEALAFQLWAHGSPLAVDCGRGISYDDPLHSTWYKTPYAHNMVVVDGASPGIKGRKGRLHFWARGKEADFLGLTHTGYADLGVSHRRCVLIHRRLKYAVFLDFLDCRAGDHRYEWVLNSPLQDFRMSRGLAVSPHLWVGAGDPVEIEAVTFSKVKMALPLPGRSTWGQEREDGTNLRFVRTGGEVLFPVLLIPRVKREEVAFSAGRPHPQRPNLLEVTVTSGRFRHRWLLDCREGTLESI